MHDQLLLQVYINNRSLLVKFAIRLIGCKSRAEDIVQDTFFRIPKTPQEKFATKAQLSYLFQIIRNLTIDHYRKQTLIKKHFTYDTEKLETLLDYNSPEITCSEQETIKQVADALTKLPKRTRYAFEKYRLDGIPQKDIAKELGVSTTLVNFMISDASTHCRNSAGLG